MRALLFSILFGTFAHAQTGLEIPQYPSKFVVSNVPAGDVLNIRAAPNASSEDLGDFENGEILEVIGTNPNGKWSQINFEEGEAWVVSAYLEPRAPERMEGSKLPLPLQCFGTEPFWQVEITQGGFQFETPENDSVFEHITRDAHAFFDVTTALIETESYSALIKYEGCSDGMSNRAYGLSISLFLDSGVIGGCCSIVPN